jgi:hypothetical protein
MTMNPMIPKNMAMIKVIQAVQRQPLLIVSFNILLSKIHSSYRWLITIKPPTMGPATGPMKVADANTATAIPRSTGPNILKMFVSKVLGMEIHASYSASSPPMIPRGADAAKPPKNLQMKIV